MKKKLLICSALLCVSALTLPSCFKKNKAGKDEYEGDRLILNLRNLYFSSWDAADSYTELIQEKFKVKIVPSSYDYNSWDEQVSSEMYGGGLKDAFHFDLESFNFGNTYYKWANDGSIKAIPDDLSRWPHIKNIIQNTTNINALKLNGHIYGLPLAYNQADPSREFSPFTYVYRRDWIKQLDQAHSGEEGFPLYRENDIYTWEEFNNIIEKLSLRTDIASGSADSIGDAAWGFPSLTNFYKESPHCYALDGSGKVVNAFTTDKYIEGLNKTGRIINDGLYFDQITNTNNTKSHDDFVGNKIAIYFDNFSLANYTTLRREIKDTYPTLTDAQVDDRSALMKVKGPDGKYHLESSENWWSMTFFNADISDAKLEKILDILEYLLGEEGTKLAIYGKEGYDYTYNDGEVELVPDNWPKTSKGEYATKINGAKYLREMITLNNDTSSYDPFTDQSSYQIIQKWQNEMKAAKANGQLYIYAEPSNVKWLATPLKNDNTSGMLEEGNDTALRYCYGKEGYSTESQYKNKFNTAMWNNTLKEINQYLGK